ncbi:hypothetical protein FGM00_16445 [Aggregatimonas sangjinii]|uniref:Uncharacterized protein n=1 Tax=Aggregatimonas sangjinii TaxID=2583587 RepID=A0A5B7SWR0_9FLAO|nr:hypothetical protein [Aggregatimonas sangjinii]QCX01623.1 hypothetical protein FGM00_16445 [Aggregatimonas sangjinii]
MRSLVAIIDSFSEEEKQEFLLLQRRKNRRTDAKNEKLLRLLDTGIQDDLDIKLYGKPAKNAFHALCKRLQDNLIDFVANRSFSEETSEEMDILKLVLASRIFFEKKKYKVGIKTLDKAEKIAKQSDVYSILNEIYHTKIQYAHLNIAWSLPDVIQDSEANMKSYQRDFQLNRAYALIKAELKNPDRKKSVKTVMEEVFLSLNIQIDETLTFKSLFQLMEITATSAKLQNDYYTISPMMTTIYTIVGKKGILKNKHRYYYLNILNLLAITHFRNKRFRDSMQIAAQMEREMDADNGTYRKRFHEKLCIIKALNLNYTGDYVKALELLQGYHNDSLDIKLILPMCLMQQSKFSEAYQSLLLLNHSDDWYEKKMGLLWVLKKNIIEILLLIELDKQDLVFLRLERFNRRFAKKIRNMGEQRVLTFMELVTQYYEMPREVISSAFSDQVQRSFHWLGAAQEDIFVMSFYAWLKAKMENKNLYTTTLELVGQPMDAIEGAN